MWGESRQVGFPAGSPEESPRTCRPCGAVVQIQWEVQQRKGRATWICVGRETSDIWTPDREDLDTVLRGNQAKTLPLG